MPEAYYDGNWHMLDPDGEVYYLDDDGETISGVNTLEQRPDIIRKYSPRTEVEKYVERYTTTENNSISPCYKAQSEAKHTMDYVLRPGESLTRSWDNRGLYFSSRYLEEPRRYGSGRFSFEPVFEGGLYKTGAESVQGLKLQYRSDGWRLTTAETNRTGTLVYRFHSPYPIFSAAVQLKGSLGGGRISIEFSENGDAWLSVWATSQSGDLDKSIPLKGFFRNGYGRPVYDYFIRLTLISPNAGATWLSSVRYTSDIQLVPHALPTLVDGQNTVQYVDDTSAKRAVQVVFRYDAR